jgi:hypothetical protein
VKSCFIRVKEMQDKKWIDTIGCNYNTDFLTFLVGWQPICTAASRRKCRRCSGISAFLNNLVAAHDSLPTFSELRGESQELAAAGSRVLPSSEAWPRKSFDSFKYSCNSYKQKLRYSILYLETVQIGTSSVSCSART